MNILGVEISLEKLQQIIKRTADHTLYCEPIDQTVAERWAQDFLSNLHEHPQGERYHPRTDVKTAFEITLLTNIKKSQVPPKTIESEIPDRVAEPQLTPDSFGYLRGRVDRITKPPIPPHNQKFILAPEPRPGETMESLALRIAENQGDLLVIDSSNQPTTLGRTSLRRILGKK